MDENIRCCKFSVIDFYERRLEGSIKSFIPLSYHPGGSEATKRLIEEANISRDSKVLDVASGTGETAIYIAMNFGSNVIGVDLSRKMVEYANTFVKAVELDKKVDFILADAERIPLRDNTFDAAISECTLCLVPDMLKVLYEMRRVVKFGAKVAISDVILAERLPESLANTVLHASCISGAKTLNEYIISFEKAGLKKIRAEDITESVINQIHQFLGGKINHNKIDVNLSSFNASEPDIINLQKLSISLWLSGKIKYYMISGVKF
ncbi:MAG: methyltransferase domain-containing protein [Candidatus Bathyarchaeia archaeon]